MCVLRKCVSAVDILLEMDLYIRVHLLLVVLDRTSAAPVGGVAFPGSTLAHWCHLEEVDLSPRPTSRANWANVVERKVAVVVGRRGREAVEGRVSVALHIHGRSEAYLSILHERDALASQRARTSPAAISADRPPKIPIL